MDGSSPCLPARYHSPVPARRPILHTASQSQRGIPMKVALPALLFAVSALCAAQTSEPADKPIELHHIDVTHVNTAVSPCDNFYQYVCGKLNAENPIPP